MRDFTAVTMPAGYIQEPERTSYIIEFPSEDFKTKHFIPDTYREEILRPGNLYGPLFQLSGCPDFPVSNIPNDERGHFCGSRMPKSPSDGKSAWGIADHWGNTGEYCRKFFLQSDEIELAMFTGVPRCYIESSDSYLHGSERVANLNNLLAVAIIEEKKWRWSAESQLWLEIPLKADSNVP